MSRVGTKKERYCIQYPNCIPTSGNLALSDVDTQINNIMLSLPDCEQGWKTFVVFRWNFGSLTQFAFEMIDLDAAATIKKPMILRDIVMWIKVFRHARAFKNYTD
jgi:hypothetical protein